MLGGRASVEPVQEGVGVHVDEELRAARVRLAGICHREGARLVADLGRELVGNVPAPTARDGLAGAIEDLEAGAVAGTARAGPRALGIPGERAAELVHETRDHAVEVDAVVEPRLAEVDEVRDSDRHLVQVELRLEGALGGLEGRRGVGTACRPTAPRPSGGSLEGTSGGALRAAPGGHSDREASEHRRSSGEEHRVRGPPCVLGPSAGGHPQPAACPLLGAQWPCRRGHKCSRQCGQEESESLQCPAHGGSLERRGETA
mmetsp:Transcript_40973/g.127695  ORF Transcript_40973/g.127695 Transcript_40973/m.127695 type:complete len:260 (+) Transcript_40973:209-988(+)